MPLSLSECHKRITEDLITKWIDEVVQWGGVKGLAGTAKGQGGMVSQRHPCWPCSVRDTPSLSWYLLTLFSSIPIDFVILPVFLIDASLLSHTAHCYPDSYKYKIWSRKKCVEYRNLNVGLSGGTRRERSKKPLEPGYLSQDVGQWLTKEFSVTDWRTEAKPAGNGQKCIMLPHADNIAGVGREIWVRR